MLVIFKDYIEIIIGVIAILGILIKGYFLIRKHLDDLSKTFDMIQVIFTEITPNSGSSIKDKVNQIDVDLDKQRLSLEKQNIAIDKISRIQGWLLDNEPGLLFETDNEGKFIWVNKQLREFLRRDMSFLTGNGWKNVIHDEDREEAIEKFISCIKDGIVYEDVFRICNADRAEFNIKCVASKAGEGGYMGTITLLDNNVFFK
jgi:PAS domain-containing protein